MLDVSSVSRRSRFYTPFQALAQAADAGPCAGEPLVRWLLAQRWSACPFELREDVLQEIAVTLLDQASAIHRRLLRRHPELVPGPRADQILTRYVRTMVRNRVIDHRRRPTPTLAEVPVGHRPFAEERIDLLDALEVLDVATQSTRRARPSADAPLRELEQLAVGEATMDDLIDQHRKSGEPRDRTRARLYKRQQRARAHVCRTIEMMVANGDVRAGAAAGAVEWADTLWLRRDVRTQREADA